MKPKSPREQKSVIGRSEKVVESPRHQIKSSKEAVSKVISEKEGSKPTKIEYKRQDVVHNTIKDKVQLYRQTVESKDDSIKSSDKKEKVVGKQSNPLVLRSKPKAINKVSTTQKVDVLIPVSKELPNVSKKVEIEIEKEPKVGQKRKYDQIKNIASEIEKK
jgi:hypothetical protein